jgi:hypothetical protein
MEVGLLFGRKIDNREIEKQDYLQDKLVRLNGGVLTRSINQDIDPKQKSRHSLASHQKLHSNASGPSYWEQRDLEEE